MAACGIAADGGVRCHSRYFPCDLCVPLHEQALVTPLNTNGTNGNINDNGGARRPGEPGKLTLPIDGNEDFGFVNNCGQLSQLSIVNNSIPSLSAASESLLFNSFHDILPGSCMERAVEEQLQQLGGVCDAARKALHAAMRAIATAADTSVPMPRGDFPAALPFVAFNPHPWEYRGPLELEGCIDDRPDYFKSYGSGQAPLVVRDPRGRRVPFQIVPAEAQFGDVVWRSRVVFDARIPARGFAVYTMGWDVGKCSQITNVHKSSLNTNGTNVNANVANVRVLPMPVSNVANAGQDLKLNLDTGNISTMATLSNSSAAVNTNVANVQVLPIPVSNVANAGQDLKLNLDTGNISTMATLLNASAVLREISNGLFSISARIGAVGIRILRDGKPWLKGAGLQALLFRDPYGSWGTNDPRQYDESVPPVAWRVECAEAVEGGPLRSALWVRLAGERSWLELTLRLATGRDAIDCEARLLWNERAARLKLSLPCGAAAADCAVPGAVVRRTAALGEVPFVPWARTVDRSGSPVLGFASDALCGLDMARGALRPSVVRASGYAWVPRDGAPMEPWRPATDLGEHRFRFLLAPGTADLPRLAAELLQPPATALAHVSSPGRLGRSGTLVCRENGWRGYDQTLSERKGRNRAGRCVLGLAQLKG